VPGSAKRDRRAEESANHQGDCDVRDCSAERDERAHCARLRAQAAGVEEEPERAQQRGGGRRAEGDEAGAGEHHRQRRLEQPVGGDGIALDPTCVRAAGTNVTGIYATVPAVDAERLDTAKPVIAAFKTEFGRPRDFGPYTLAAYDATAVVYDALDRAIKAAGGSIPIRGDIITQLASTKGFAGATGTFGFDAAGDTTLRVVSIFKPAASRPMSSWTWVDTIDYSNTLPY